MSRLVHSALFAFSLFLLSIASVGCSSENTVIEETRSDAEIQQELDEYEAAMDAEEEVTQ